MWAIYHNGQRSRNVIIAFNVLMAVALVHMGFIVWRYYLIGTMTLAEYNDQFGFIMTVWVITQILNLLGLAGYLVGGILFILWMRRAYYNLNVVNPDAVSYSDNWAAAAWFVPILSFVRPYQIMRETWNGTQDAVPHRLIERKSAAGVGVWWAVFLAWALTGFGFLIIPRDRPPIERLLIGSEIRFVQELLTLFGTLLAIKMVKTVASFENALWEEARNPSDSVFAISSAEVPPAPPAS